MKTDRKGYQPDVAWQEAMPGGIVIDSGSAADFKTGDWRSEKPIMDAEKCKNCFLCWTVCPDCSIIVENEKVTGIDYDHCKGCGLCKHACKFGAIDMVREG